MPRGDLFTSGTQIVVETCYKCAVEFALPVAVRDARANDGAPFYCPNGHGQHYTKSENDKLKDRIVELEKIIEQKERSITNWKWELSYKKGQLAWARGHITKLKKQQENSLWTKAKNR